MEPADAEKKMVARHATQRVTRKPSGLFAKEYFDDQLVAEEPLEIRIHDEPVAITMRTPGDDFALVAGFLHGEGLLGSYHDLSKMSYCPSPDGRELENIVNVTLASSQKPDLTRLKRNVYATSSCGVCGKAALEQIKIRALPIDTDLKIPWEALRGLVDKLSSKQVIFRRTGGLHATGIFSSRGELQAGFEDVGRHNAVDKAIGHMLLEKRTPLTEHILLVSGRASFEILQKAVMARIPVVCAVSAPSSLAVETAREFGVTLVGFVRGDEMNVYTHPEHLEL